MGEIEIEDVEVARFLGALRLGAGVALFLAPGRAARAWTGERDDSMTARLALRGMAARDIALGAGLLLALENDAPVRGWLEGGALSDALDALATLGAWRGMGGIRRLFWLATEVGSALLGAQLARALDESSS